MSKYIVISLLVLSIFPSKVLGCRDSIISLFERHNVTNCDVQFQIHLGTISHDSIKMSHVTYVLTIQGVSLDMEEQLISNLRSNSFSLLDCMTSTEYDWVSNLLLYSLFQINVERMLPYRSPELQDCELWRKQSKNDDIQFWDDFLHNFDWKSISYIDD